MFDLPLSLVIEGLVAILLVITISYCILLNSRLKRLRADEEGLRATIAELLTATEIAERAIQGLRNTTAQCDKTLVQRLGEATRVSDELSTKLTAAGAVVQRVGNATDAAAETVAEAPKEETATRRLDNAARALQDRLQRVAS